MKKYSAVKFEQAGLNMYLCKIPAKDLISYVKVDTWNPLLEETDPDVLLEKQGYQRTPIRSHYTKIGRYVTNDKNPFLPTSVLISARCDLSFDSIDESSSLGFIAIDESCLPLYSVDGQHRIEGLKYAINELGAERVNDFIVPVTIVEKMPKLSEIRQFHLVNSTQKKVRTDLADRLLRTIAMKDRKFMDEITSSGKDWKVRAINIADLLNQRSDSPWYGRIKRPNAPKGNAIATETSFTTSLQYILNSEIVGLDTDEIIAERINSYWLALKDLMPEAFENPSDFVIQKTPGMYSLHMVFPTVLIECLKKGDFSKNSMKEILERCSETCDADYWRSGGDGAAHYNSVGAFRILARELKANLGSL